MNAVVLFNGLGNQMSQYAFFMAKKHIDPNCKIFFDKSSVNIHNGYELERIFGIQLPSDVHINYLQNLYKIYSYRVLRGLKIPKLLKFFGIRRIVEDVTYDFDLKNLEYSPKGICYYWGGWHSEKYFKEYKVEILKIFSFPKVIDSPKYSEMLAQIKNDENSISIHIRRGDYLKQPKKSRYKYYYCDEKYYLKAIKFLRSKYQKAHFYIFSDDMEWCKTFIPKEISTFIDFNTGEKSWRDMSLISNCRHHINSNSTFSWWGAWLSPFENGIVIRPPKFLSNHDTKDFYPENWLNIDLLPD